MRSSTLAPKLSTRLLLHSFTYALIFSFLPAAASASPLDSAISGYYKMLTVLSKARSTKESIYGALQRLRLEFKPRLTENIGLNIAYDHELLANDFSHTPDFDQIRQKNLRNFAMLDTDRVITDTDHVYERHLLHRAFIKFESPHSRWTLGKQLVDWGRMRFYSPLDLFNQPLPSDIEADERLGFDALNVEFSSDNFSGVNFIYGPARHNAGGSFGLRLYKKLKTYDTFLIAAKKQKDKVAGFAFDGYIGNAGLRGEFTYTKRGKEKYPRAGLGVDYNFSAKLYGLMEYFYNGAANGDFGAFSNSLVEARNRLSLKKHIASFAVTYAITPLFKLKTAAIYDTAGKSAFLNPELRYNVGENFDVACGSQLFIESDGSEFENYRNVYYVEAKYFF